jgi:hypothetical protein
MPSYAETEKAPAAEGADAEKTDSKPEGDADKPAVEEEKQLTLAEYQKVLQEGQAKIPLPAARKAGEGVVPGEDWADAKPIQREERDTSILGVATEAKPKRKEKKVVEKPVVAAKSREEKLTVEFNLPAPRRDRGGRDYRYHSSEEPASHPEETTTAKTEVEFPALSKS